MTKQMVDSNAGLDAGLVGSFDDVRQRMERLAELGVNTIVCQFDEPMRDAGPFMKRVIRPLRERRMLMIPSRQAAKLEPCLTPWNAPPTQPDNVSVKEHNMTSDNEESPSSRLHSTRREQPRHGHVAQHQGQG